MRARTIDLAKPGAWKKLDSFLNDRYSGGTDGNEMLKAGIRMLKNKNYAMADMLIISDFIFEPPQEYVRKFMEEEHLQGTRFYGLQIGIGYCEYDQILDKVWQVKR